MYHWYNIGGFIRRLNEGGFSWGDYGDTSATITSAPADTASAVAADTQWNLDTTGMVGQNPVQVGNAYATNLAPQAGGYQFEQGIDDVGAPINPYDLSADIVDSWQDQGLASELGNDYSVATAPVGENLGQVGYGFNTDPMVADYVAAEDATAAVGQEPMTYDVATDSWIPTSDVYALGEQVAADNAAYEYIDPSINDTIVNEDMGVVVTPDGTFTTDEVLGWYDQVAPLNEVAGGVGGVGVLAGEGGGGDAAAITSPEEAMAFTQNYVDNVTAPVPVVDQGGPMSVDPYGPRPDNPFANQVIPADPVTQTGTTAAQQYMTGAPGVNTGIPQGGFARNAINSYLAGPQAGAGGGGVGGGIGDYYRGRSQQIADDQAAVQEQVQNTSTQLQEASEKAYHEGRSQMPTVQDEARDNGWNPSNSALNASEWLDATQTIADQFDSIDTFDPTKTVEEQVTPEEYAAWQELPTSNPAQMAADTLYMNNLGTGGGGHLGNTLASNIFGGAPDFQNPSESGSYGGSLMTGGNAVAGSGLGAAIGGMVNNSLIGSVLGTNLPEYASTEDMINDEVANWEAQRPDTPIELTEYTGPTINNDNDEPAFTHDEIIAMHHPAFDITPAESAAAAGFDMNDPSTWSAPVNNNTNDDGGSPGNSDSGGGGCCFIMLEARYGDGTMDKVVRQYRDEKMTDRNRRGYYKLAEVLVPLMRKSKVIKWLVTKTFADPLVCYGKYYYGQNKWGWIFKPVERMWMKAFDIIGGDTEFIRENGEVV